MDRYTPQSGHLTRPRRAATSDLTRRHPSMNQASNVDDAEIRKFESLAGRWWDPESEFKPLHDMNPLRLDYIRQRAPLDGARALDVGCGGGILSESLARDGARVTAIDMGAAPLAVARLHAADSGLDIDYRRITAEQLAAESPGRFDVVACMEMLEHVPDPAAVVAACAALTRPGGSVFFSTLNRNPKSFLMAIVGAEYVLKLLPRGTHSYRNFIRPSELAGWCRAAGLAVADLRGMHYHPLTRAFSLAANVDVNYLVHCRRRNPEG